MKEIGVWLWLDVYNNTDPQTDDQVPESSNTNARVIPHPILANLNEIKK